MCRFVRGKLVLLVLTAPLAIPCIAQIKNPDAVKPSVAQDAGWRLKDFADLASALSLIVAAGTLYFAFRSERNRRIKQDVTNWQRVVVYRIIAKGKTDFEDIKRAYLDEAQQLAGLEIGKGQIQDSALRLVLMSLIESKLISVADGDKYLLNIVSDIENAYREFALQELKRRRAGTQLLAKMLAALEDDSRKYSLETLFRATKAAEFGFTYEEYNALAREFMRAGMIEIEDGRVRIGSPGAERIITRTIVSNSGGASRLVRPGSPAPTTAPNERPGNDPG